MARQSAMHLDHHIGHLARLEMWPVVTMARDKSYYRSCCFAVLVSTVTWWWWYLSVTKRRGWRAGVVQYSIPTVHQRVNRSGFSGHVQISAIPISSKLVFFYVEIPTSFYPCNLGLLPLYLPPRVAPRRASPRPLPPLFESDPSRRRSDAADFTEALRIRDCMTF